MTAQLIPGAEPWSHVGTRDAGVLVLHGFTGNPSSVRVLAEAAARAGLHVELPRLPGHGTRVEDMLTTGWADWTGEVRAAGARLAARTATRVVAGLSMGGALTLWAGLEGLATAGLVCVNPVTRTQSPEVLEMLREMLAEGTTVVPGIGSDIAKEGVVETAYTGTPVAPLISLMVDGLAPMQDRYHELDLPLLLVTSRQDHVVDPADSEHLARTYGGPVEHLWLERSYHVATMDHDQDLIVGAMSDFLTARVGA